jgi:hypothetical protein
MSTRGRKPGAPKTGGRKPGVPNKATRDIKALAQEYTSKAIEELAKLAGMVDGETKAESEPARIAALKELLDRGHGKAPQSVDMTVRRTPLELSDAELEHIAAGGRAATHPAANGKAKPN